MNTAIHSQSQNILILGAGELGLAVLQGFLALRDNVTPLTLSVLLREKRADDQRLAQFHAWQVEVITADFSQHTTDQLAAKFARYDAIINCSGFVGGKGTQLKITEAVIKAGVRRYIPWQFGVDYDRIGMGSGQSVWDEQLAVRQRLRQQQHTQWIIISTGLFMSYLFDAAFGVVDAEKRCVKAPGSADYAVTVTTPEDIGRLTALIFTHRPAINDQIVKVAGDTLTYRQLAQLLDYQLEVITQAQLQHTAAENPHDAAAAYRLSFARPDGVAWSKAQTFNVRQNIAVTDVRKWLTARGINDG